MALHLCFVQDNWAFFTSLPLAEQWGNDWDDKPYQHSAGRPYGPKEAKSVVGRDWELVQVAWDADLDEACEGDNWERVLSVQQVNAGAVPWLRTSRYWRGDKGAIEIWAGVSLEDFVTLIRAAGGDVWFRAGMSTG